jgi:hypothetical protein
VAPVAVNVDEPTTQIAVGEAAALTVGLALTSKLTVCVEEQAPVIPVTVYTVVTDGETTTFDPVSAPGLQE